MSQTGLAETLGPDLYAKLSGAECRKLQQAAGTIVADSREMQKRDEEGRGGTAESK